MKIMTMDYTWERREEIIRREEREEGRKEGCEQGMILAYMSLGLTAKEISEKMQLDIDRVCVIMENQSLSGAGKNSLGKPEE
jgi:predicted transposase YdaD